MFVEVDTAFRWHHQRIQTFRDLPTWERTLMIEYLREVDRMRSVERGGSESA